ncbi:hypothetical protein B0O80DRAFT_285918 [Mortierella sp. GBAus27b]|nr:hypothetical protein B0O80DRAFT_285918 [Mortierella sp. GBAus27b]
MAQPTPHTPANLPDAPRNQPPRTQPSLRSSAPLPRCVFLLATLHLCFQVSRHYLAGSTTDQMPLPYLPPRPGRTSMGSPRANNNKPYPCYFRR